MFYNSQHSQLWCPWPCSFFLPPFNINPGSGVNPFFPPLFHHLSQPEESVAWIVQFILIAFSEEVSVLTAELEHASAFSPPPIAQRSLLQEFLHQACDPFAAFWISSGRLGKEEARDGRNASLGGSELWFHICVCIQGEVSQEMLQTVELSSEGGWLDVPFAAVGEGAWGRAGAGTSLPVVWPVIPPLHSRFGNTQQSVACDSSFSLAAPKLAQRSQPVGSWRKPPVSVTCGLCGHSELLQLSLGRAGCPGMPLAVGQCQGSRPAPRHPLGPCVPQFPCVQTMPSPWHSCCWARNEVDSADFFFFGDFFRYPVPPISLSFFFHCKMCLWFHCCHECFSPLE